jgi:hypothetical protein
MTEAELAARIERNKRIEAFREDATAIIRRHAPLLSDDGAREVARIVLFAWEDLRKVYNSEEASEIIEAWRSYYYPR